MMEWGPRKPPRLTAMHCRVALTTIAMPPGPLKESCVSGITVVGSINLDLLFPCERIPRPGETLPAHSRQLAPGGKGANQATAAARLGAPVTMVGAVGDDEFSAAALALLDGAGVDLSHLLRTEGTTGIAVVYVEDAGENSILIEAGANGRMDADRVAAASAPIADADIVVLQGEIPASGTEAAAALTNGRVILNLAPVLPLDADTIKKSDPLVVNEHEGTLALQLLGFAADNDEAVVQALLDAGVTSVVMTRGSQGALVGDASGIQSVAAVPVDVVDTTGAGDAFTGALATRLLLGEPLVEAAAFAVRVASFACTGRGAQPSYPWAGDPLPS